ncbi:hypothetical protein QP405_05805 [Gleimia europaea]|nr:hypothetical protein [Gleimia europaea]MDK7143373.1 hypothetical protein [Gleimia europaea]
MAMPQEQWIVTDEFKEKMGLLDDPAVDPADVEEVGDEHGE